MVKTTKRIVVGALGLAVAGAAALLALAFAPTLFGYESLIVTSGSMGEAMPVGSVAVTRMVDGRAIAVGDVVSFRHAGSEETVTHRVSGVSEENGARAFETKGDANPAADPEPVVVSGPIHRVERVIPYAGYLVRSLRSPAGALLVFLVPILGLAFDRRRQARGLIRRRRQASGRVVQLVCHHCGAPPEQPAGRQVAVAGGYR